MADPARIPSVAASPAIQQEYGALLRFYEPQLGAYHTTLIMSEREHKIFLDQKIDVQSPPGKIRAAMKEAFPEFPVDQLFKSDTDLRVFMMGVVARRGAIADMNGEIQMGAAAVSMQIGTPEAPLRIGLVSLPLRLATTPEEFAPFITPDRASQPASAERMRDHRTFTAAHEFYHLIQFAERGVYLYAGAGGEMVSPDQTDEVYADRSALADVPALVRAGLIKDPLIAVDVIAARRLETMQRFVLSQVQSGPGQGALIALDDHAVGYSVTSGDSLAAQKERVTRAGTEIRAVFRSAIDRAFEDAADGKAPPHVQAAYAESQESYERMRKYYPPPSDMSAQDLHKREQTLRLQAFTEVLMNSPEFMRDIATQMRNMPSLSATSAGMAGDFVNAYERLIKQAPAPAPEKEATPAPAPIARLAVQAP